PGTGWTPRPLIARQGGQIVGVAPLYVKSHSQGEYVFDHAWAHAYENAGGRYYPKLQIAVPFTPATGRRLLVRPELGAAGLRALIAGAMQITERAGLSGLHVTFCTEAEVAAGKAAGMLHRAGQQFHWHNRGYGSFEDFLADLSSRKRKTIRRERARANAFGGEIAFLTGDDIQPRHWDAFWAFYQDTGSRKWGRPYLTREFFDCLHQTMREDVLLVMCTREGRAVAGALNFIGRDTLYGRYWGCIEHHDCLHFEACYYRAIDWAIANRLAVVEAGAQGPHKLARGYLPVTTHSLHYLTDDGFARAVAEYLEAEREAVEEENEILTSYGPFRKVAVEERE
ncbi:MAG: N-acetyltransferase, partial [Alphaproteobacteria bacterium]